MIENGKLHVCVITQQFRKTISGVGRHANYLVKDLLEKSHQVTVIAPYNEKPDQQLQYNFIPVPAPTLKESQARWISLSIHFRKALLRVSQDTHFDIIHFTDAREALFNPYKNISVGNINDTYSVQVNSLKYYKNYYNDWITRWVYYHFVHNCEKYTLKNSLAYIIANSEYTRSQVLENYHLNPSQVITCYKAVDLEKFTVRNKLRNTDQAIILFVGSNMQRKGLRTLINASPSILREFPKTQFWVVGDDPQARYFRNYCQSLNVDGAFKFLGWKSPDELLKIYQEADILAVPSLVEALGVVFLEAMACGVTVIGSKVGGTAEIITHGQNGQLVTPNQPEELAEAILRLLKDSRLRSLFIQAGFNTVKKFSTRRMMDCTYEIYSRIVN